VRILRVENPEIIIPNNNSGIVVDDQKIDHSFIDIKRLIKSVKKGNNYLYRYPSYVSDDKHLKNYLENLDNVPQSYHIYYAKTADSKLEELLESYIYKEELPLYTFELTEKGKNIKVKDDENNKVIINDSE